jgi:peroxiredoxin
MSGDEAATIEIAPESIEGRFVPTARPGIGAVRVGHEVVLGRIAEGTSQVQTAALNESGALVWQCFDGSGTIDEIAADIAAVFGAEVAEVRADVVALARAVGGAGFLVGVHEAVIEIGDDHLAIAPGLPFPELPADDENGTPFSIARLRGRRTLLVSWSATCNYCETIAGDLAGLVPALADAGVDVVLAAIGGADANRRRLDRVDFGGRLLLLRRAQAAPGLDGLGTPVAYVIDADGDVAEAAAFGATDVVALARRIASRGGNATT